MATEKPPAGLKAPGRRLWRAVLSDFDLERHELDLLGRACVVLDALTELTERVRADGTIVSTPQGLRAHPALVESRQQDLVFAKLLTCLRIPLGEGDSKQGAPRLQHRGLRGVHLIHPDAS